ncbi:MAG: hypothetical protein ACI4V5_03255 [Prevotella sp.]
MNLLQYNELVMRKEYISLTAYMTIAYLVIYLGNMFLAADAIHLDRAIATCLKAYCLYICISGCFIFSNVNTKQQIIRFKMLPASDAEKYLVKLLYVSVIWAICGIVAFILADVISIFVCWIFGTGLTDINLTTFFEKCVCNWKYTNDGMTIHSVPPQYVILIIFIHSLYVLGGTVFRRYKLVFSSLVLLLLFIFNAIIISNFREELHAIDTIYNVKLVLIILLTLLIVLAITNYTLSYIIFKRMQVVNNKYLNI